MKYDVIIAGSGPSGAAAARGLVDQGLKVLIVEKKKLPRYKICSGIIFKKSQKLTEKYFGQIPETAYVTPKLLQGVRLWSDLEQFEDWPFDKENTGAPNIWRSEYDHWLIKNTGADVRDCCLVNGFQAFRDRVRVEVFDLFKNETRFLDCKYLISAEGGRSVIRAKLDPVFERGLKWFVAYQNYYEGSSDLHEDFYHGFLDLQYGEIYSWFSVKNGLQVFGTSVKRGEKIQPYLSKYTEMLKKRFNLSLKKLYKKSGCIGNDMCAKGKFYLGKGNILLVGESAGFLNAFGEGISCALSSGFFAADAIRKGIETGDDVLSHYTELTKTERRQVQASWKLASRMIGRSLMPV